MARGTAEQAGGRSSQAAIEAAVEAAFCPLSRLPALIAGGTHTLHRKPLIPVLHPKSQHHTA